jgi:hypothetical protein
MAIADEGRTGRRDAPESAPDATGRPVRKPTFSAFYRAVFVMALLWPLEWAVFGNLFKDNPHGGKIVDAIVLTTSLLTWYLIRRAMRSENRAPSSRPA